MKGLRCYINHGLILRGEGERVQHERRGRARARAYSFFAITPKKLKWVAEWDYLPSEINNPAKMKRQQPQQNGEKKREKPLASKVRVWISGVITKKKERKKR